VRKLSSIFGLSWQDEGLELLPTSPRHRGQRGREQELTPEYSTKREEKKGKMITYNNTVLVH
jgi:hypothetical protein